MPNYTKLFNSIVTSTIWMEIDQTRIVWITMLAIADQHGEVHASIPGLARLSGVSIDATRKAIDTFLAPDPDSRTPENEGRRVAAIDGGWELLNHAKYRAMASKEDSKKATADRVKRHRARKQDVRVKRHRARKQDVTVCNGSVTPCNGTVTVQRDIAEAEAEAEAVPPNPQGGTDGEEKPNPKRKNGQYLQTTETLWPLFPAISRERSSKLELDNELRKATQRPGDVELIFSLDAWNDSEAWNKDGGKYAPAAHRWVKARKWEVQPSPFSGVANRDLSPSQKFSL